MAVALVGVASGVALASYGSSAWQLVHPFGDVPLGFTEAVMSDAVSWAVVGNPLYGNLTEGYAALSYAPGLTVLVGLLLRLRLWNGWPLVITYLAGLSLAPVAWLLFAAHARRAPVDARRRAHALAAAMAPLHLVVLPLLVPLSLLHEGRADVTAWTLGLAALVTFDEAHPRRRLRLMVLSGALAALAFTFKQTTVVIALAAVAVTCLRLVRGKPQRAELQCGAAFVAGFTVVVTIALGLVLVDSGPRGVGAVVVDAASFDRALTWPAALHWLALAYAPAGLAFVGAHVVALRTIGRPALDAHVERHAGLYGLALVGTLWAAHVFRYDGADWNHFIGPAIAWTWLMIVTVRRTSDSHALGPAVVILAAGAIAVAITPGWQASVPAPDVGFPRTRPVRLSEPFRVHRYPRRAVLLTFAEPDSWRDVCGSSTGRGDTAADPSPSYYDPRLPYRDAVRSGRIYPGVSQLVDHYAIGRGPARPLLEAIRGERFACIIEAELLDRDTWRAYVGPGSDPEHDFDAVRRAIAAHYEASDRTFEGRIVYLPRRTPAP